MTLFWHNHFATGYTKIAGALGAAEGARYMAAKASEDPGQGARPDRDAPRQRARQLPRHPDRHRERHGDARLARRPDQHQGAAAGELRPRDHGAVHDRRRQLHRSRRVCRGARVHRLEPRASGRDRRRRRSTTSSSTTPSQHDTEREDLQLSDLSGRRQDDSGARGGRRACRTASTSSTALAAHPEHGALPGDEAVPLLRQRVRRGQRRRSSNRIAHVYLQSRLRHEGGDARGAAVAASSGTRAPTSRATPGRSSSSSAR